MEPTTAAARPYVGATSLSSESFSRLPAAQLAHSPLTLWPPQKPPYSYIALIAMAISSRNVSDLSILNHCSRLNKREKGKGGLATGKRKRKWGEKAVEDA